MKRLSLACTTLALLGCGKDPTVVPVRNLERPSDMAFVCMREVVTGGRTVLSAEPMAECQPHLADNDFDGRLEFLDPAKPRKTGTFGLVTNSSRGELAVVDMDYSRLVDLDTNHPGYNLLPLGTFPEVIAASQDGCMVVTANRGSCDLTMVDPQRLLRPVLGAQFVSTEEGPLSWRIAPTTGMGNKLQAAPQEIAFLPQKVTLSTGAPGQTDKPKANVAAPLIDPPHMCKASDVARAVVTFPSCDLVAVVELPSGKIVSSMYVRPEGLVDAGTEPVCPADCRAGEVPPAAFDAAPPVDAADDASAGAIPPAADGGAPVAQPRGPFRIGALAIRPEGNRLYVGGASAEFITAIDLVDGALKAPASGGRIPLHEGPGGVRRLRLTLDPFTMEGTRVGRYVGNDFKKYLYAFARDNSVRIVNVGVEDKGVPREHECDVNIDPRPGITVPECPELRDDPSMPRAPRRAFAQGPGLRIPNLVNPDQPSPVPQDIAFGQLPGSGWNAGGYGYLLASDGETYVVNIESRLPDSPVVITPDNAFRDDNQAPLGDNDGVRVSVLPSRAFNLTSVPLPIRVPLGAFQGARIEGIARFDPLKLTTWVKFPDPSIANTQPWFMVWEGALPGTEQAKGVALPPEQSGPAGGLQDKGQEFCQAGVLPGDIVLFTGCTQDTDCSLDGTSNCRQGVPGTPGLCFPSATAKDAEQLARCSRHLVSRRRYEVVKSTDRRLDLRLKLDERPKTALDRCTVKEDCNDRSPFEGFDCLQVHPDEPKRCVKPCGNLGQPDDELCRSGTVCEQIPGAMTGPLCVEGPKILSECWPLGARYQVQAGHAFVVSGERAPRPPTAREVGDVCVPDLGRNPLLVNRIPLDAPHCADPEIDDLDTESTVKIMTPSSKMPVGPPGTWGNPCLFWGVNDDDQCQRETEPDPSDPSRVKHIMPAKRAEGCNCVPDATTGKRPAACHVKALFQNSQVQFVVTNLEQYAGDANVTRFDVFGGFVPEVVLPRDDVIVTMGVRILTGPMATPEVGGGFNPYIFVIDQGRTSSSGGGRGQVLRFDPRAPTSGRPRYDSNYNLYPFQIQ